MADPGLHRGEPIFTARVRSTTEGYSFTLLVCSQGWGSGPAASGGGSGPAAREGGSGPAARGVRSSCQGGGSGPAAGGGQVQLPGGVRSSQGGQVQLPGGVRSSRQGRGVRSSRGGGVSPASGGGSASCALLRAVCLLRSRRRTFLFPKPS